MEIVAKNIDVKFILDLSEVGENDPLLQNVISLLQICVLYY